MEVTDFSGGIRVNSRCDQSVLGAMGYSVGESFLRVSGFFERKASDFYLGDSGIGLGSCHNVVQRVF